MATSRSVKVYAAKVFFVDGEEMSPRPVFKRNQDAERFVEAVKLAPNVKWAEYWLALIDVSEEDVELYQ